MEVLAREQCPKYLGRVIEGVDLSQPTPQWLTERLRRCGLRSVDPVVDVTNYVLIEQGQPMHAFDLSRLQGGITVRMALPDDKLTLLNGQQIELDEKTGQGDYANFAVVTHSLAEFVLDFIKVLPGVPKSKVQSRIIISPVHAKTFSKALQDNIEKFEKKYGNIKTPERNISTMFKLPKDKLPN